ncbi:DUF6153 family protein [Micromonospora sp. RHAY321]|uniref:DUF6153 family protein n=1 Tax=Micromonospora sp. RHAY321 TaxID=2944807 RepID=UPI00207CB574|nr:DUF6153 family protein [Micromonospora sp. RHAY321]MCO1597578.1 DUF6153 family protein [Micromonospora sp. RHAY321]
MKRTIRQRPGRLISLPRVLLLVLLALGVAGMHTFGHGGGGHTSSGHDTTAVVMPHDRLASPVQDDSGHRALIAQIREPRSSGSPDLGLFTVCLAVVGAFGLAIALALLRVRSHRERCEARTHLTVHRGGRSPPALLLGLRVAAVSVLRI